MLAVSLHLYHTLADRKNHRNLEPILHLAVAFYRCVVAFHRLDSRDCMGAVEVRRQVDYQDNMSSMDRVGEVEGVLFAAVVQEDMASAGLEGLLQPPFDS